MSGGADDHDYADDSRRKQPRLREMATERLSTYVQDIIRRQTTPLEEIVRQEVLPYLPATALLRFRSVCQSWLAHVSAPFFEHRQSTTHRSLSGFFLCDLEGDDRALYIPFSPSSAHSLASPEPLQFLFPASDSSSDIAHPLASSYGLVVAVMAPYSSTDSRRMLRHPSYIVCNPATSRWTRLPPGPKELQDGVALVFEPSDLNFFADYLVVSTFRDRYEKQIPPKDIRRFVVFCSRAAEWRQVSKRTLLGEETAIPSPHGVAAGGKAYWRTSAGTIVGYDPADDTPEVLDAPPEASAEEAVVWQLGELSRRLCCVSYNVAKGALAVSALVGDCRGAEAKPRWEKLRVIDIAPLAEVRPLMFHGGDGEVVVWVEGSVMAYKTATGEGRVLCDAPLANYEFLPYISSLVLVKEIHGEE